jgi:phosphohistidine phosphatase
MDIVVVRHGIAVDRDEAAKTAMADGERPLTEKGRRRMKQSARGIARLVRGAELIVSSPLARAVETAKIVRRAYDDDVGYSEESALLPDAPPSDLASALADGPTAPIVVVVGHEPHLGRFVGWSVTGQAREFVELGKGGACLLRFEGQPGAGIGRLIWLLPPRELRRVG